MTDDGTDGTDFATVGCGCGDYRIQISETAPIYTFGAVCPECGNHFGWISDADAESGGDA